MINEFQKDLNNNQIDNTKVKNIESLKISKKYLSKIF